MRGEEERGGEGRGTRRLINRFASRWINDGLFRPNKSPSVSVEQAVT